MSRIFENVTIQDELDLFLTIYGVKPAALVEFHPFPFNLQGYCLEEGTNPSDLKQRFEPEVIERFQRELSCEGLVYDFGQVTQVSEEVGEEILEYESIEVKVAKDLRNLERLSKANSDFQIGLALGYPRSSVRAFRKRPINFGIVEGNVIEAHKVGMQIPTWLAYLSHVPRRIDLTVGIVSEPDRRLGILYQDTVREHNPELAKRIEEYFLDIPRLYKNALMN